MRDDRSAADLIRRARSGDKQAWDVLVERYAPLVWSICRRYRLSRADANNVSQGVWRQLVDRLAAIHDPADLPSWLAAATQRECGRILRTTSPIRPPATMPDPDSSPNPLTGTAEQELLTAKRHAALREAFAQLPPCCQQLLTLLIEEPHAHYPKISATLDTPVDGIGPQRRRCLDKLRRHPAMAALINTGAGSTEDELNPQAAAS